MDTLPETVLQFGTGKFLRGFADLFIHQANESGQAVGRIVAVQSTGTSRAELMNRQAGGYHVLVRGLTDGAVVDRVEESHSLSRALGAAEQWPRVLAVARSPELRYIVSNTAEVGYNLDPGDKPEAAPPSSFPAKLLRLLHERFLAGLPGVTLLPCELFEQNAERLRGLVQQLSERWQLPGAFGDWLRTECTWRNALVDRIVANRPSTVTSYADDPLLVVAEPYALWALDSQDGRGAFFQHPAIQYTSDVRPYFLRKVRILNAAHTALLCKALPGGINTVREAVLDSEIRDWLERLLFEEIVPILAGRVEEPETFARQTLERFENPFIEHKLSDIAMYHEAKVKIRLVPTRDEYVEIRGRVPARLQEAIDSAVV
jgi:tagaturonate reductase